jgi:hypothetical protein
MSHPLYAVAHRVQMPCLAWEETPFANIWQMSDEKSHESIVPGTIGTCIVGDILYEDMISELISHLRDGGTIICYQPTKKQIDKAATVSRLQYWEEEGFVIIRKLSGKKGIEKINPKKADPEKVQYVFRLGANGDQLMMTPIVQYLYEQGKHIVYITNNPTMWKGDPRITELWGIPRHLFKLGDHLESYLTYLKDTYGDKYLDFSQAVEITLLAGEDDTAFKLPQAMRIARGAKEYMKWHFEYKGLPIPEGPVFPSIHLSSEERKWAMREVMKLKAEGFDKVILWNIFGSSFHKMYPWMFDVWELIKMNKDRIAVMCIGDAIGGFAVGGSHSKFVRNYARDGKTGIRKSLALHSAVDAVVTPETWSLTASFSFDASVVAMLSHSLPSCFPFRSKDRPLFPSSKDCPCYPCFQMHFYRDSCPRGKIEQAAVLCMDQISPRLVYQAIKESLYGDNANDITGADQKVS